MVLRYNASEKGRLGGLFANDEVVSAVFFLWLRWQLLSFDWLVMGGFLLGDGDGNFPINAVEFVPAVFLGEVMSRLHERGHRNQAVSAQF